MRKKLILLILSAVLVVAMALPALACTPPLHPPKMPDMQSAYDAAYEAGKKAVENVVIPDSYFKNDTETESETETVIETETESEQVNEYYFGWEKYIPKSLKNKWASFLRR
jgi:hypothetical protein|nr:MAG TPA: AgrD [Caudoviricetes sp.]